MKRPSNLQDALPWFCAHVPGKVQVEADADVLDRVVSQAVSPHQAVCPQNPVPDQKGNGVDLQRETLTHFSSKVPSFFLNFV